MSKGGSAVVLDIATEAELPRGQPVGWERPVASLNNVFENRRLELRVILTVESVAGENWLHVSASRRDRIPSWEDMVMVKRLFVGSQRKALQVMPPDAEAVNIHPHVLHLWCCLDRDPLPDFRREDGSI